MLGTAFTQQQRESYRQFRRQLRAYVIREHLFDSLWIWYHAGLDELIERDCMEAAWGCRALVHQAELIEQQFCLYEDEEPSLGIVYEWMTQCKGQRFAETWSQLNWSFTEPLNGYDLSGAQQLAACPESSFCVLSKAQTSRAVVVKQWSIQSIEEKGA